MKKKIILTLSFVLLLNAAPVSVFAESIDNKIEAKNQKINEIINSQKETSDYAALLEKEIAALEKEYYAVLAEKQDTEQQLNTMNTEIAALEVKIEKRSEQLEAQARATQAGQDTSMISVLLNATSISDAISKVLAVNTIVTANNDIIQAQKADKEELNLLKNSLLEQVKVLEAKTAELAEQEDALAQAKLDQEIKLNELAASLTKETAEKKQFEEQKAEAERKKQEELKALEERKKKMAEAQALAEQQEKERQAAAQKAAEEAAAQAVADESTATAAVPETTGTTPYEDTNNTNTDYTETSSGWRTPVASVVVTSGYGYRQDPTGLSGTFHEGIDFGGSSSTVIMAAATGTVAYVGYDSMSGNCVIIKHSNGYYSMYAHLSSTTVNQGQSVSIGQQVGYMGTTGNSTGVHLHFAISTGLWSGYVNPAPFLGL
ncbi:murein hydrolase activator EnvC family protein [Enterococcus sp. CWB-B31]|uniref:murein hydrolase activator EnvC family protein n=1 Tax=Enterococcus sp. CWB-B31 TaxID=2885159 RepID=UPI001E4DB020|nr:M23 family metallopeptidase [Enterococcus sp. CWB-B31]MCB5955601.1 peptidoglycan DD-metalloendopeptidase family protein [Enterococcus sp. CWB-B31]